MRKYYLAYSLLRLDPLEEKSYGRDLLAKNADSNSVWLIGDSRMARWNKEMLASLNASVLNLGIEGQTTSQVLIRLRDYLKADSPQWLILEAGINDLKIIGVKRELAPRIITGCIDNIISIIKLCNENNVRVILINILPTGNIEFARRFIWNSAVDSSIVHVNSTLREFCITNNIAFFNTYPILCDNNKRIRKQYQDGFLHINEEAYMILTNNLIKEFGKSINN